MRTFERGQKVKAACVGANLDGQRDAEIVIASPNHRALCIAFEHPVAIYGGGGMVITATVPLLQQPGGDIADLWGNSWTLE